MSPTLATQSRIASLIASLSVLLPASTLVHRRAEQLHADDVQRLAPHVLGAHVDAALEAEQRARGRRRDAVLPAPVSATMRRLAHALGEQRLAERVVDLVRAGMRQVLALEQDANVWRVRRVPTAASRVASRRAASAGPRSDAAADRARRRSRDRRAPRGSLRSAPRSARPASRERSGRRRRRSIRARPDRVVPNAGLLDIRCRCTVFTGHSLTTLRRLACVRRETRHLRRNP